MKKILLLITLGVYNLLTFNAIVAAHNENPKQFEQTDIPPNTTEIELKGDLVYNVGPNSVEAYLCKNSVQVQINQNLGYVSITLMGEIGNVVYNATVNTAVQQIVYIPIGGSPSGKYTLILNNANGFAEGEFVR